MIDPRDVPRETPTPELALRASAAALVTVAGWGTSEYLAPEAATLAALAFFFGILWLARDGSAFLYRLQLVWATRGYKNE